MLEQRRTRAFGIGLGLIAALLVAVLLSQPASAAPAKTVFDGAVPCEKRGDGAYFCSAEPRSTVPAWDGVPIDVDVGIPSAADWGPGPYPLMMMFHGYGGHKADLGDMRRWMNKGYATFSMTDRGFHESCGSAESQAAAGAACDDGYIRLIDNRYEVRDAQEFAGQLVDEGLVLPTKIGSIGGSYGGGMSMALGALKDRMVMPDYSLVPWESPEGTPMSLAAAAPEIPWTDLAYSLQPNGSTLDYLKDSPYTGPVGVSKESLVNGLYYSGKGAPGYYAPVGTDPTADITGWHDRIGLGEPYGADAQAIITELTQHHSSYYIDHSEAPAPMLMSSGFTDDLFPADETIRYYNRTMSQYPDANLGLFFGDFGHPRANNKPDVTEALRAAEVKWMNYWVKGEGAQPREGVTAYTETCPSMAPSGGPFKAPSWARMARGEIRLDGGAAQTIAPDSGDPAVAAPFNPVGGSACGTAPGANETGTANYRLDPAPSGGYTLMGAATVVANYQFTGDESEIAARLLDVGSDGKETLVSRGLWRPTGDGSQQVFQLHPNGWWFRQGHVAKLELLAKDWNKGIAGGYARPSNDQKAITVSNLQLRLAVRDKPGSLDGLVGAPAAKVLPAGGELASDFAELKNAMPHIVKDRLKWRSGKLNGKVMCPTRFVACHDVSVSAVVGSRELTVTVPEIAGGERQAVQLAGATLPYACKGGKSITDSAEVTITSKEMAEPVKSKATVKAC